ncbi:hypothetical protein NP493_2020g00019 [Ridgeia piscesae]|uniref:Uncharacterized protein n=1 Tax=Ridgeia piscesae TaxID=27915 RepID=A0AAD9JPX3_RIDPI|nr:hypothetical protein NP493_2020g00019 [Ridgeia piscesae]
MHTFNEESAESDEFFPEFANLQSKSVFYFIDTVEDSFDMDAPDFHLAVVSALEPLVVYRSVLEKGFGDSLLLPDSDKFDCGMCVHALDVDFDGENELLLGTYGQELIVYKFNARELSVKEPDTERDELNVTESSQSSSRHSNSGLTDGDFHLLWQRNFADPLLAVDGVDVTGDGLQEIVVLSLRGLHVLQHDLKDVAQQCVDRMKQLILEEQQSQQEDIFKQLLSENLSS